MSTGYEAFLEVLLGKLKKPPTRQINLRRCQKKVRVDEETAVQWRGGKLPSVPTKAKESVIPRLKTCRGMTRQINEPGQALPSTATLGRQPQHFAGHVAAAVLRVRKHVDGAVGALRHVADAAG